MNSADLGTLLRRLQEVASTNSQPDAELLARYSRGEQAAFAGLVTRYSGLVWSVGRRILRRQQDGEDVFQSTFLALSRKASQLTGDQPLAPWLYTVTVRLALKIKKRQSRERYLLDMPEPPTLADEPSIEVSGRELAQAFDEEMERLPEKYREALVLCCLESLSRDEAAAVAGCSLGVMKNRLERGRKLLRKRLERRGIAVPTTLLLVGLTNRSAPAVVCAAACRVFETASPSVIALASEAIGRSMMMMKMISLTMAVGLTAAGIGLGSSLMVDPEASGKIPPPTAIAQAKQLGKEEPAKETKPRLDNYGDPLPGEALARFGTVRFRQGPSARAVSFSPDDKKISIASWHGSLGFWQLANGKELLQLEDCSGGIAFSSDWKILAAGADRDTNNIRLWETCTGKIIRELNGHFGRTVCMVFSSDGKTVISGGYDKAIRFWDVATGQETAILEAHAKRLVALALSIDGKLLASGAHADKIIRVWDVETRKLVKELLGEDQFSGGSLSFSPDGKKLISILGTSRCIIWDVAKGQKSYELIEKRKTVRKAAFSPNGKWLAAGYDDGTIRWYEPATGKELRRWGTQSECIGSLLFSRDSKTIATTSGRESGVRFWDVETGKDTRPLDVHRSEIDEMKLSPDGKSLWSLGRNDRRAIRWNVATAEPVEVIPIPEMDFIWGRGTFSPDRLFLAWSSEDNNTIHLMDLKTHKDACEPLKIKSQALSVEFSPDGKILAFGCDGGSFYIWKWQTDRNPKPLTSPDGKDVLPQFFTPDGKHLVTASINNESEKLYVWDVATGTKILSFPFQNGRSATPLAISPDGKWAVANFHQGIGATLKSHIKVIDLEKGKIVREMPVDMAGSEALAFSPDGRILAFGEAFSRGGDVKLIEFATGDTISTFKGHHSGVYAFQFTPDGRTLFSSGGDSTILKWDATARHDKGPSTPDAEAAWQSLAKDASKAYPARWDLVDAPKEAVALIRKKILPAKKLDGKEVQLMVDALDAPAFQDRQKAAASLIALGYSVEPILRKMVETEERPEMRAGLQRVLTDFGDTSFLRIQRAMQVLETIGNDDAKLVLRELADGAADSMLTKEAAAAMKRIAK